MFYRGKNAPGIKNLGAWSSLLVPDGLRNGIILPIIGHYRKCSERSGYLRLGNVIPRLDTQRLPFLGGNGVYQPDGIIDIGQGEG